MITSERLREILHYDPETGDWTWLISIRPDQGQIAGRKAGGLHKGYVRFSIDRRRYYAHRLAFLYMTGKWPEIDPDHRDENRSNNKWSNLRLATKRQNIANCGMCGSSGYRGVSACGAKWIARISDANANRLNLGLFKTKENAALAYNFAALEHFGEFAHFNKAAI